MAKVKPQNRAFVTPRQRQPRVHSPVHLDFVGTLPCLFTGQPGPDVCHIKYGDVRFGKRSVGKSEKPDDAWVLPYIRRIHSLQHSTNEFDWWVATGIDPLPIALALKYHSGNIEICTEILGYWRTQITNQPT